MISLFALLSVICATKCLQIVEVCAQPTQLYQRLLPWGPLCQALRRIHWRKTIISQISVLACHAAAETKIFLTSRSRWIVLIEISWYLWHQAENISSLEATGNSGPHSEGRSSGARCPNETRSRHQFCETVQTWPARVHNQRAWTAPSIPVAVTQTVWVTGPKRNPGSGRWGTARPTSGR